MTTVENLGHDRTNVHSPDTTNLIASFYTGNEHPAMSLPFTVLVDGRGYEGISISMVEARVVGLAAPGLANGTRMTTFRFDFGSFAFSLPITVRVETANNENGELLLAFAEPAGPHMPQLRYILNTWLSGDMVSLNDMLRATTHLPKAGSEKLQQQGGRLGVLVTRASGIFITFAASAFLLFGAAAITADRFFVHELDGPALALWDGPVMRATAGGQMSFFADSPAEGAPLYAILTSSGTAITAVMPCACDVKQKLVSGGDTVLIGEPIARLATANSGLVVEALFSAVDLKALSDDARITVTAQDGSTALMRFGAIRSTASSDLTTEMVVALLPETALAEANAGKPVRVSIDRTPGWLVAINSYRHAAFSHLSSIFRGSSHGQ